MNYPVDASATTYIQKPVFTLTLRSIGANAHDTVTIKNNLTGEILSVYGVFANGDVLVFDTKQETVTQNGTAIDAFGVYPRLLPVNNNDIEVDTTFTYSTLLLTCSFVERFL